MKFLLSRHSILPFFSLSISYTLIYITIMVIIPISHLFFYSTKLNFHEFIEIFLNARVLYSFKITFFLAALVGFINLILGLIISWTIVKYNFYGKDIIEMIIDLPLALPTAVAGLALATLYSKDQWLGDILAKFNIHIAFSKTGMIFALIFVGLPIAIRTIEPVIHEIDPDIVAAAKNLGANNWQIFRRIYLPSFLPTLISAYSICFARALSEYGALIFIASNIPKESEIISLLIYSKIEQFDYNQASSLALIMLISSFSILVLINYLSRKLVK